MNRPAPHLGRPATYQDVLDAPPHMTAQIASGKLHLHPRPASLHSLAQGAVQMQIGSRFHKPDGWWIVPEPELHLVDDVLVPDVAGWRRDHIPVYPDTPFWTNTPDWICEVLSPGTAAFDRSEKRMLYALHAVPYLWLVDPRERTIEVFGNGDTGWILLGAAEGGARARLAPFDAMEFDLATLWPD